ncbi:unnamed protein product, partial [Mesorhabditis spiculigera]
MLPIDVAAIVDPENSTNVVDRAWGTQASFRKLKEGPECCSKRLISTHHIPKVLLSTYYYFTYNDRTIHTTDKETAFEKMCADRTEVMLHYWLEDRIEKLACAEKKGAYDCWRNAYLDDYAMGRPCKQPPADQFAEVGDYPAPPCQLLAGLPYETIAQYLDTDIADLNKIAKLKWETTIPDAKKALAAAETRLFESSRLFNSLMQRAREIAHADTASTKALRELCLDEAGFMPSNGVLLLGPLQDPSGPVSTMRVASEERFTMIPPDANTSISTVSSTSSSSASTTLSSDSEMEEEAAEADRLDGQHEETPAAAVEDPAALAAAEPQPAPTAPTPTILGYVGVAVVEVIQKNV